MFTFADSAWHVLSAIAVFLSGFWISWIQKHFFALGFRKAVILYLWHTSFCLLYFQYSLTSSADASTYFQYSLTNEIDAELGSNGIAIFTSLFSVGLGLSYGGTFLVFNIFGFIGMIAFASALQDINQGKPEEARRTALLLLLLPGLSFWSSAIGKDALTFMAAGIATWAALSINTRYVGLVISIIPFLLARPPIAGVLLASVALALLFASNVGVIKKAILLLIATPFVVSAVTFGMQFAGLSEATSTDDIGEYFEKRQEFNLDGGSSVDIAAMSVPMRLVTYLYRPLFFDAGSLMGLVVSLENLLIVVITLSALKLWLLGRKPRLDAFASMFFLVFFVAALFILANATANLGIAIRQKWMFMPMLLTLAMSILFAPRKRRKSPVVQLHPIRNSSKC